MRNDGLLKYGAKDARIVGSLRLLNLRILYQGCFLKIFMTVCEYTKICTWTVLAIVMGFRTDHISDGFEV